MSAAADYFLAAVPEPYQILGLRLKPFSLGHYILMRRFDVAFAADDETQAELSDLILACLICSRSYSEFVLMMDDAAFKEDVKKWGEEIGLEFDFAERVKLLNAYMTEAFKQPTVIYEGEPSSSGAHWSHVLKCALVNMGYSEQDALNMPLAQAFNDFYRHAESQGAVTIASPELAALMEQVGDETCVESESVMPFIPMPTEIIIQPSPEVFRG